MRQATVLIGLCHGLAVRNVLQTDIFRTLQKSGVKIVLLVPNAEDELFRRKYNFENVYFEKLKIEKYKAYLNHSRIQQRLKKIRWFTLNGHYDITTISDWYEKVYKKERSSGTICLKLINFIEDNLIRLLRLSTILRKLFIYLECIFFTPSYHRDIFLKYKPQYVLVTSLGFFDFDSYIIREAKRCGAKIISLILAWDNTSTRGIGAAFPDKVIAWTDIMRKELVQLHDIEPKKIYVGGVAHFDHYFHQESICPRGDFYSRFGLSPDRKLIYFATKSPTGFPWNPDMVEIIAEAINNDMFIYPCQLLVRLHPIHFRQEEGALKFQYFFERYDEISHKYKHVVFNVPYIQSGKIAFDMPDTELFDVASILYHADIMVNVFSTMNIEASIFDCPIVNVGFEGSSYQKNKRPRDNIRIDEMQTHNQRIVKTGGVRVAYNRGELIDFINMYLKDPEIDKKGRLKIVEEECGPNHGQAGRRIGSYILDLLKIDKL